MLRHLTTMEVGASVSNGECMNCGYCGLRRHRVRRSSLRARAAARQPTSRSGLLQSHADDRRQRPIVVASTVAMCATQRTTPRVYLVFQSAAGPSGYRSSQTSVRSSSALRSRLRGLCRAKDRACRATRSTTCATISAPGQWRSQDRLPHRGRQRNELTGSTKTRRRSSAEQHETLDATASSVLPSTPSIRRSTRARPRAPPPVCCVVEKW